MLNVCQKYGIFIGKHICNNNSCLWEQKLVKHRCLLSSNTSVVLSQRSYIYSVKHFHCFLYQCRCAALLLLSATIHLCHSLVHYRSNRHRINNDNGDASVDAAYIHLQWRYYFWLSLCGMRQLADTYFIVYFGASLLYYFNITYALYVDMMVLVSARILAARQCVFVIIFFLLRSHRFCSGRNDLWCAKISREKCSKSRVTDTFMIIFLFKCCS